MRHVPTIIRRELAAYLLTPLGYIILALFIWICGFAFAIMLFGATREPTFSSGLLRDFFAGVVQTLLLFIAPALTMRLFAEEWRTGTMETLLTNPVTDLEVVLGKYGGALAFYLLLLLSTAIFPLTVQRFATPDWGRIACNYLALFCCGGLMLAVGLFASSLTRNQIVAYIITLVLLLTGYLIGSLGDFCQGWLGPGLQYLSLSEHTSNFWVGLVSSTDIVYFLSATALILFGTVKVVESNRWR